MNNDFFLPSDYQVPVSQGNYMRLADGANTFRVLSSAIVGFEYWTSDNKPKRLRQMPQNLPVDIRVEDDGTYSKIKHFWAFVVYNYDAKQIQILEVTQKSIMNGIKALVDNVKWGDPKRYDITITRTGEKLNTEYSVQPNPHEPLADDIKDLYEHTSVNLEALFDGADPFAQ